MNSNEQLLKRRWKKVDAYLKEYLVYLTKQNKITKNKLQDIADLMNVPYENMNNTVSKKDERRLYEKIREWTDNGILDDYFKYLIASAMSNRITYLGMLKIFIYGAYLEELATTKEVEFDLFVNVSQDAYKQGIDDIKPKNNKKFSLTIPIITSLLSVPVLGHIYKDYMEALYIANADDLYKQVLINKQLGREIDLDDNIFKNMLQKQLNRTLSMNDDKLSGAVADKVNSMVNLSYLQAGIDSDFEQCKFIAEVDEKTTTMCKTLDNQLFYINKMNVYSRFSAIDGKNVIYHTKGLIQGENLPPIFNHFHWCRSTITYLLDIDRNLLKRQK